MKKKFGDRYDGRRVRNSDPTNVIIPFIMRDRNDSEVFFDAEGYLSFALVNIEPEETIPENEDE